MDDDEQTDSERTVVTTYVPAYQKEKWQAHAAELDMSQSEFVKTMVQAGRRGFGETASKDAETTSSRRNPRGSSAESGPTDGLKQTVLDALEESPYLSWDDLVDIVIGDVETELETTITDLQEKNEITHSPRKGGYVRTED